MKELFQNLAPAIMDVFGTVIKSGTLNAPANPSYNPVTGAITSTPNGITVARIVLQDYTRHEKAGGSILPTDRKALIPSVNCNTRPIPGQHTLTVTGEETYNIENIVFDAAEAIYELQLRLP